MAFGPGSGCILGADENVGVCRVWGANMGVHDWTSCQAEKHRSTCQDVYILSSLLNKLQWSAIGVASLLVLVQQGCLLTALYRLSSFRCVALYSSVIPLIDL
jgi:hypothetical protein